MSVMLMFPSRMPWSSSTASEDTLLEPIKGKVKKKSQDAGTVLHDLKISGGLETYSSWPMHPGLAHFRSQRAPCSDPVHMHEAKWDGGGCSISIHEPSVFFRLLRPRMQISSPIQTASFFLVPYAHLHDSLQLGEFTQLCWTRML